MAGTGDGWFSSAPSKGVNPVDAHSMVELFVDAEEYYADLRREVEATTRGDLICWIAFDANVDPPMPSAAPPATAAKPFPPRPRTTPGDKTWLVLLTEADKRGVGVRALLNLHPSPKAPRDYENHNYLPVARVNSINIDGPTLSGMFTAAELATLNLDPHALTPRAIQTAIDNTADPALARRLAGINNCAAINDFRYLWLNGTHHQKLVVVRRQQGLTAFIGTADLEDGRITQRWCEVVCRVRGPQAAVLYWIFCKRWAEHTELTTRLGTKWSYLPTPPPTWSGPKTAEVSTQCATTFGNPLHDSPALLAWGYPGNPVAGLKPQFVNLPHRAEIALRTPLGSITRPVIGNDFFTAKDKAAVQPLKDAAAQARTYAFAPTGNTGIYEMITTAVRHATSFIYMEDQYLLCDAAMGRLDSMAKVLADKLRSSSKDFRLIIFCTRIEQINSEHQGLAGPHRRHFIEMLTAAGGSKVTVCQYKSASAVGAGAGDTFPFYVHSKTWVFDDAYLIVGSANCNRRGYTHDSELDIGVYDAQGTTVKDIRTRIWLRRLNTDKVTKLLTPGEVQDPLAAAKYWDSPATYGLTIENHRIGLDTFVPNSLGPQHLVDTYGYGDLLVATGTAFAENVFWDAVVDPEGT